MIALKKVWVFLKTHWYIPVIIVLGLLIRSKSDHFLKMLQITKDSYNKQIEEIDKINEETEAKKENIHKEYEKTISKIEEEFKKKNEELKERKKKEVKKLVNKYYDNPDELANEITKRFGFKYVP
jgi:gas vesicle protein